MKFSTKLFAAALLTAASSTTFANDFSETNLNESVNISLAAEMATVRYTLAADTVQDVINDVTEFCQSIQLAFAPDQGMLAAKPVIATEQQLSE
ncbi:hypothetical protein QTP81_07200 [Alteromonas sp. ASW11-36]|uniref:FAD:protein FMN transferase n=1 Tax=Alteromonas arenosi TaxID=3055817 RepID=A0ABT7SW11_9ALTE|nr:hypothetical protein [Alteromonas sp. ASW11-36]MDM7860378.1 hypothetical protein [Alteromonas sp. ASW11-36]